MSIATKDDELIHAQHFCHRVDTISHPNSSCITTKLYTWNVFMWTQQYFGHAENTMFTFPTVRPRMLLWQHGKIAILLKWLVVLFRSVVALYIFCRIKTFQCASSICVHGRCPFIIYIEDQFGLVLNDLTPDISSLQAELFNPFYSLTANSL